MSVVESLPHALDPAFLAFRAACRVISARLGEFLQPDGAKIPYGFVLLGKMPVAFLGLACFWNECKA